ncbi:50S ribosomal protein L7/L12 [compost metagenome]
MTQLPPEAIAALERGNLIEAIKIVRDRTGMDLKSSKEAVERYAHSGAVATGAPADWQEGDWGRGEAAAETGSGMQGNGPAAVPAAALAALARGQKVEAVRLTREATGLGLAEAKQLVEAHQNPAAGDFGHLPSSPAANPMAEPGRVTSGGFKWLPVIVVLLIAVAAWSYFKGA